MNVVLYVADALRADHCSCYGHERETTPTIDALAADGIRVENCFTQATWTRAAAGSILTGCYPDTHKTETRSDALSADVPYLPEAFSRAGFETLGVSAMANVSTPLGFDRGFDAFVDLYRDEAVTESRRQTTPEQEKVPAEDADIIAYPRAEDANAVMAQWLEDHRDQDCFVLVWAIDPHDPYDPLPAYEQYLDDDYDGDPRLGRERGTLSDASTAADFQRLRDLYDGEIRYMDDCLGDFVETLRETDQYAETTIAVTGDHGESFGERTWQGDPVLAHNTPPFDERLRVPLVVKPATKAGDGLVAPENIAESVDIAPSLLHAAGIDPEDMQGTPLTADHRKDVAFSKTQQEISHAPYFSVRTDQWKYIRMERPAPALHNALDHPRHFVKHWLTRRTEWLYDIAADPGEQTSVTDDNRRRELAGRLDDWRERAREAGKAVGRAESDDDEGVEQQLEALGYLE